MPTKLTTTVKKIGLMPNNKNSELINKFYEFMKSNGVSERHQNNNLKAVINFAKFLGPEKIFYDMRSKDEIIFFLNTKIKDSNIDPDKKWITTWNDYLWRIKYLFRWLHNYKVVKENVTLLATYIISSTVFWQ